MGRASSGWAGMLIALGLLGFTWAVQADVLADKAHFGCDMDAGACYFRILAAGGKGSTNFTLRAGERELVTNLAVGQDTYCVCIDTPVPANWCAAGGHSCIGYLPISAGYNNQVGTTPDVPEGLAKSQ